MKPTPAPLDPPIFIGGMMKSGTSLLRVLLGRHPSIFAGLETHWFSEELADVWRSGTPSRRLRWLQQLYDVPTEEFDAIRQRSSSSIEFFDVLMRFCTERAGKRRWAEKTPGNVNHLPLIWDTWPAARFIHVRRDFRDTYASWKNNGKASLVEFVAAAQQTCAALPAAAARHPGQFLEIEYEKLVTTPALVMRAVLEFVDEPWVDGIDRNDQPNDEYERVKDVVGVHSSTALSLKRSIFADSVGQWRALLTLEEAQTIETALSVGGACTAASFESR